MAQEIAASTLADVAERGEPEHEPRSGDVRHGNESQPRGPRGASDPVARLHEGSVIAKGGVGRRRATRQLYGFTRDGYCHRPFAGSWFITVSALEVGTKRVVPYSGPGVHDASEPSLAVALDPLLAPRPTGVDSVAELFGRHRRRLMGLAAAVTLDRSVADEIVQEAFAGLTSRIDAVRDPEAYLQRSVINLAIRVVRKRERARSAVVRQIEHSVIPEIDELWGLVGGLPVQQRAVVVLRFWEDLSQQQIASVLDIPLGSVKSTLHRALLALKDQLGTAVKENR